MLKNEATPYTRRTSCGDGQGGDVDYSIYGQGYASQRRPDPSIAACICRALGNSRSVLNVGAGTGSYEPDDRYVLAIEPSATMRAQRSLKAAPAIYGIAENLPLDNASVDAAMALVTVHQWTNLESGLKELRRVARGPVVIMTFDPTAFDRFWLNDYASELLEHERSRFPKIEDLCKMLGGISEVQTVPIPKDCRDGFTEAFYARPESFLDPEVRRAQSGWSFIGTDSVERSIRLLQMDLDSGEWERRYGKWRSILHFEGSLTLIVNLPDARENS